MPLPIPVRPAAYMCAADMAPGHDSDVTYYHDMLTGIASEIGWPEPVTYIDPVTDGQPGSQYSALTEAIAARLHDAVLISHPRALGGDLAVIEAFVKHCREHEVHLRFRRQWELSDPYVLFGAIRDIRRFTVTDEHLRLLRRSYVEWDSSEFGAPGISPKRPYGNSNVYADIADILQMPENEWTGEDGDLSDDAQWRFLRLHVETATALQIALATGEFRPGSYSRSEASRLDWKRDQDKRLGNSVHGREMRRPRVVLESGGVAARAGLARARPLSCPL
jgi:hypothetical protein